MEKKQDSPTTPPEIQEVVLEQFPTLSSKPDEQVAFFARALLRRSHAPYSGYRVSCVLVDQRGNFYPGVNVESGSYSLTSCAERNAFAHYMALAPNDAVVVAVYIASSKPPEPLPCGACRHVLYEHLPQAMVFVIAGDRAPEYAGDVSDFMPAPFVGPTVGR